jgi:hypothetical protein
VTELEKPGTGAEATRERKHGWPWVIVGVVLALGKVEGLHVVEHHRTPSIVVLAILLVVSLMRVRISAVAITTGVLVALVLAPPFLVGAGIALGLFVTLMTLFYAVSTVLHMRQKRPSGRRSARPPSPRRSRAARIP